MIAIVLAICLYAQDEIRLRLAMLGPGTQPEQPSIVMLGDSHFSFVNWQLLENCRLIANAGVGGDTTEKILARLPSVIAAKPKLIIAVGGTNDALQKLSPDKAAANLTAIRATAAEHGIDFALVAPPPLRTRSPVIERASTIATVKSQFSDDDFLPDGIHLRRSGYAKWRDAMEPLVRKHCS